MARGLCAVIALGLGTSLMPPSVAAQSGQGWVRAEGVYPELEALLNRAIEDATFTRRLRAQWREAEAGADLAGADRLPRLGVTAGLRGVFEERESSEVITENGDGWSTEPYAHVFLTQPLYHWGVLQRRAEAGDLRAKMAWESYLRFARVHLNDLRKQYVRWKAARAREALGRERLNVAERALEATTRLEALGTASAQQRLLRELELAQAQARLVQLEQASAAQRVGLEPYLPEDEASGTDTAAPEPLEVPLVSEAELERLALLTLRDRPASPEMAVFEHQRSLEQMALKDARRHNFPRLNFVAGVQVDQLETAQEDLQRLRSFLGVQVEWNVFDGWRGDALEAAVLARQRILDLNIEDAEERWARELGRLLRQLRLTERQLSAHRKWMEVQERRRELARSQSAQSTPSPALSEVELVLLEAEQHLRELQTNYLVALIDLDALLEPYDPLLRDALERPR